MTATNLTEIADRAKTKTDAELLYSLFDIRQTLPCADAIDREMGTDNGGKYRDEAGILRAELLSRGMTADQIEKLSRKF